jgi:uncharacterized damage-inducible protein DinB
MTWTAPQATRIAVPTVADERAMLEAWLDWHRATLLTKCAGLTGEQLARRAAPPSELSLLGLVRHLADVERAWFRRRFRGEPIGRIHPRTERGETAFHSLDPADAEHDLDRLVQECDAARTAAAGAPLDQTFHNGPDDDRSLRWIYLHMIEEYARHNGHADLLRERIDGRTGD